MTTSRTGAAAAALLAFLLGACCTRNIPLDQYERLTLEQKIAEYEQSVAENCSTRHQQGFLLFMSAHREEAALAMIDRLEHPRPHFPAEDAMRVLSFVHARGFDLRNHRAMEVLQKIARDAPDEKTRAQALRTIAEINAYDPSTRKQ